MPGPQTFPKHMKIDKNDKIQKYSIRTTDIQTDMTIANTNYLPKFVKKIEDSSKMPTAIRYTLNEDKHAVQILRFFILLLENIA